jgi:hypothetical protein
MNENVELNSKTILEAIKNYVEQLNKNHSVTENRTGFEKNDRNLFINNILGTLGYKLENILDDVSQHVSNQVQIPDLRLYGTGGVRSRNSHSQIVIETKNYDMFKGNKDKIDYLQLKKYIRANESQIRFICCTDYVSMFVFNANKIKQDSRIDLSNLQSVDKSEIEVFSNYIYDSIKFENLAQKNIKTLKSISYPALFNKYVFINPVEYECTNSIANYEVRHNFITELYNFVENIKEDIKIEFLSSVHKLDRLLDSTDNIYIDDKFYDFIKNNSMCKSFFLWGYEMNYLSNIFQKEKTMVSLIKSFINNLEYREAYLLTAIYSLINKTFFLRCLEDFSTSNTIFIQNGYKNRYLSNGILSKKLKEGEEELIQYLRQVYEFNQPDLKQYSYILKKDIYSWILEYITSYNLLNFIRLFNDVSFKKLDQDILGDIYEHYLESYKDESNKSYRSLLGQFYTPKPIVRFMWQLTRDVLRKTKNRDLYDKEQSYLDILDVAYGSGTFLYESMLQINQSYSGKTINNGMVYSTLKDRGAGRKVEEHIFGYEINPLSKSIADINIFIALMQLYGVNGEAFKNCPIERLKLFRTDSYELEVQSFPKAQQLSFLLMSEEVEETFKEKEEIISSKSKKYDIIITNPPYGEKTPTPYITEKLIPFIYAENNFDNKGKEESFSWKRSKFKGQVPTCEKNRGKIRDMYAYFIGVADKLINDGGIITLITSNTYLSIQTYKWLRKYLLENYKIHYIINFNKISEKTHSMFSPEAAIGTCIIVMTKEPPEKNIIKYLDLSDKKNILDKYGAICNINKLNPLYNDKNAIESFSEICLKDIRFIELQQSKFLQRKEYIINYSFNEAILDKIESQSIELSRYGNLNSGIGPGDVHYLVDENLDELVSKIERYVFAEQISEFNKTTQEYLRKNLQSGKIKKVIDIAKIKKFVFQKHMERYYYSEHSYIYFDKNVIWRARLTDLGDNPILSKWKLLILEDRNNCKMNSIVVDELLLPQDGGRFNYMVPSESLKIEELYIIAAILNSPVMQFYYKHRMQGNKNIQIKKIDEIPRSKREKLISLSKEIHKLKQDNHKLNNSNYQFMSNWFKGNIENEIEVINILDNNRYWDALKSSSIPDYRISKASIRNKTIYLNSSLNIEFKDERMAKIVYDRYLKNYESNLLDESIEVNITEIIDNDSFLKLKLDASNHVDKTEERINELVFEIYNLCNSEKEIIIKG